MEPIEVTFMRELNALCKKTDMHLQGSMKLVPGAVEYYMADVVSINMGRHTVRDLSGNHVLIKGETQ